jgi:mannose/cellobiose epimerase-like protein (N-acyl-D-glucosamine 2-epimerase family)
MTAGSGSSWRELASHRAWLEAETFGLLDFARAARVDGGFAWLDAHGRPDPEQPLQLWITTRMTHVFSLGHLLGAPGCGPLIDHGLAALGGEFRDAEHDGWYPELEAGAPLRTEKEAYSHAFVLLAAASAHVAGREAAATLLESAIAVIEERFWAPDEGASRESWDRAWSQPEAYRGANANMHLVEAFMAAGDATGDLKWFERALRIAERLVGDVARESEWRVLEHFDAWWKPLPDYNADQPRHPFRPFGVTPGHGLEWSRLLLQIHSALPESPGWLLEAAEGLFRRAVADGWQAPGGFVYTTSLDGRPQVTDRLHWVVAEAIAAAAALHAVTGREEYERWYRTGWDFVGAHLRDAERGSWRHELDDRLNPSNRTWRGKPDVYHAIQATLLPRMPVAPSLAGVLRADSRA